MPNGDHTSTSGSLATDDGRYAAIGALARRHSDAKRKSMHLVGELKKVRAAIALFERALRDAMYYLPTSETIPRLPADYPDPAVVADLLSDWTAACREIEQTERLLKDAGIDLSAWSAGPFSAGSPADTAPPTTAPGGTP